MKTLKYLIWKAYTPNTSTVYTIVMYAYHEDPKALGVNAKFGLNSKDLSPRPTSLVTILSLSVSQHDTHKY